MHKMINGDELRAFLVAAERGAIKRAARELHLTQPAVTRRIQRLEQALGVSLFDRRMRPPRLTRQGEIALREGQALARAFERLRDVVNDTSAPSGDFRLGLAQPVAEMIADSAIEQLRRQFPRLAIRLTVGWGRLLVESLREGTLDFAVALLPEGATLPADVMSVELGRDRLVCVASKANRLSRGKLAGFADHGWILNPEGCGFRNSLLRAFAQVDRPLCVAAEVYGHDVQLKLVAEGIGLGLVPLSLLRESLHRSKLRVVDIVDHRFNLVAWGAQRAIDERGRDVVCTAARDIFKRLLRHPTKRLR